MATERARPALHIELGGRTVLWALGAIAAAWMLVKLWPVLVVLLVAAVLVGTLHPSVVWFEKRGCPRGLALAVVFLSVASALVLIGVMTVPVLIAEIESMLRREPEARQRVAAWLAARGLRGPAGIIAHGGGTNLNVDVGRRLLSYSQRVLIALGLSITTLFLALYLIADRERVTGAIYAVVPRRWHARLERILANLEIIVGGYVRGQVITSVMIFGFVFGLLSLMRVPNALALAVFAALTDVLPFIGGLLATTPAVLAAAAARGVSAGVFVLVAMVTYQEIESRLVIPRVYGRTLRLPASAVIVALLVGGELLGILGALLALPVAAGLRMIVEELRVELPGDDPSP